MYTSNIYLLICNLVTFFSDLKFDYITSNQYYYFFIIPYIYKDSIKKSEVVLKNI